MKSYLFIFGNNPHLSIAELYQQFPALSFEKVADRWYKVKNLKEHPFYLLPLLGGTIKITEITYEESLSEIDDLPESISDQLQSQDFKACSLYTE